jgi:PTH1 family peptidyl-tRNA hydrolase
LGSDHPKKGQQVDYVLGEWTEEEKTNLKRTIRIGFRNHYIICYSGLNETMNILMVK